MDSSKIYDLMQMGVIRSATNNPYTKSSGISSLLNEGETSSLSLDAGCPAGCTYQIEGCDIKGNVAFGSGEKIFHLPNMKFYSETVINPDYGERWFCTETEAIANGWRKSYE